MTEPTGKNIAIIRLTDEFAAVAFKNLKLKAMKPVFAVLEAHNAVIVDDYRSCVQDFATKYGRQPHDGYYGMVRASFNRRGELLQKLSIEVPKDKTESLLRNLENVDGKSVIESVFYVLDKDALNAPPQPKLQG